MGVGVISSFQNTIVNGYLVQIVGLVDTGMIHLSNPVLLDVQPLSNPLLLDVQHLSNPLLLDCQVAAASYSLFWIEMQWVYPCVSKILTCGLFP